MQKWCIWILRVRQAALSVAHEMWWWCKSRCCILRFLLAIPVELTRFGAAALVIQNVAEIEKLDVETIMVTSKP